MITRAEHWLSAEVDDEMVMMHAQTGRIIGLNPVGARIWGLLEQPRTIAALVAALTDEFAVDAATCEREVAEFLAELESCGAISPPA